MGALKDLSDRMAGLTCTSVAAHVQSGLSFELDDPGEAPWGTLQVRGDELPQGRASLMIWCSWFLQRRDERIIGWDTAEMLVGRTFHRMRFVNREQDLKVAFDDDLALYVLTVDHRIGDNYAMRFETEWWSVTNDRRLTGPKAGDGGGASR